jgi:hypothetical protein
LTVTGKSSNWEVIPTNRCCDFDIIKQITTILLEKRITIADIFGGY